MYEKLYYFIAYRSQLLLLEEQAIANGLTPTREWINKTEQVYLLSRTKHGKGIEREGERERLH